MTRRAIGEGDAMTWREFLEERTALYDVEEGARDAAFWTRVETFLDECRALGRRLYAYEDRGCVQAQVSFWARRLYEATERDRFVILDDYDQDAEDAIKPERIIEVYPSTRETFGLDVELWRTEEGREFITLRGFLRAIHVRRERLPDLMRALREMVR